MSNPHLGMIQTFGFNFAPRGWALCEGQILPINQYQALFSLLGTTYGGDGRTTFGLPDLRGRTPLHPGTGPGLPTYRWGQKGGANSVTLQAANLPSHNHHIQANSAAADEEAPNDNFLAATGEVTYKSTKDGTMNANAVTNTGGGQAVSVQNPLLGLYIGIALTGFFPSRN